MKNEPSFRNEHARIGAMADQARAMVRDDFAKLSIEDLEEISEIANTIVSMAPHMGRCAVLAARVLWVACGDERLRRLAPAAAIQGGQS